MPYKKLWADMHSNLHHDQMKDLEKWIKQVKDTTDFWPIAYYPYYMRPLESGAGLEDLYDESVLRQDWEMIRQVVNRENAKGFPMFMGYEWQGSGEDGDHNVFFLDNEQDMHHPLRYEELYQGYRGADVIAIPHHIAYQPGSRGKNWETHREDFSPFAEIYSSHGCSENDTGPFDMERHLHMGPRTGLTCYERGLDKGYLIGTIASGDNHSVPAACDHGTMCVLAEQKTKESIWEGLKNRRVYGVSRTRMDIDFSINEAEMGSVVKPGEGVLKFSICAADAIDRVEILKGNVLDTMVVHSGTWENDEHKGVGKYKFAVEFGWGPNPRFYGNRLVKTWEGLLAVPGQILSMQKCFNSFGQKIYALTDRSCEFHMTTYLSTTTGHWMGPSTVVKEGFVFEVLGRPEDEIVLKVDDHIYRLKLKDLMKSSVILAEYEESRKLAEEVFGNVDHYRDDFIWQNACKVRVRQAVPEKAYTMNYEKKVSLEEGSCYRLRVHLKNGDTAWVSPIFVRKG